MRDLDGPSEDLLARIADAVAEGTPVDWERERTKAPQLEGELEELKLLSKLSSTPLAPELASTTDSPEPHAPASSAAAGRAREGEPEGKALFRWGSLIGLEWLGSGHFGEVYRAFDTSLETEVALKLRKLGGEEDPRAAEAFVTEARRLARVRHTNVLTVHGTAIHEGRVGIWTELIQGETLEKRLERTGPFGFREASSIGIDVCRALSAVHQVGLVHRDVKTGNIMREGTGRIVLMDFGSMSDRPPSGGPLDVSRIQGTPLFMAPEQLEGRAVDPRADIYALGVVLYRLVTRRFPIEAESLTDLMRLHGRGSVPLRDRRPDLPTPFIRVVHQALATNPDDRFPSAGAMELALTKVDDSHSGISSGSSHGSGADSNKGKRRWARALALPALLLAAVAVFFLTRGHSTVDPQPTPPPVLTANASVYRHTSAGDELLSPGAHVQPGDRLLMKVRSSAPMHLYVLAEDERGQVFVLFPAPALQQSNPMPGGEARILPGRTTDGKERYWQVTSAGGRESIIAIGSLAPLATLEQELARFPAVEQGSPVERPPVSRETIERLRGIGGLSPDPADSSSPSGLHEAITKGTVGNAGSDSIWVWQTQFTNPK